VFRNRKEHGAGVCSIRWHPRQAHTVATGSYDDQVRVWDARAISRGPLARRDVGGGAWRLKWHPWSGVGEEQRLLVAAMRGGCHVLSWSETSQALSSLDHFGEHPSESLAYGIDWSSAPSSLAHAGRGGGALVGSCSFYDASFRLWRTAPRAGPHDAEAEGAA
jgi:diphthamide biosynthesis protein 7